MAALVANRNGGAASVQAEAGASASIMPMLMGQAAAFDSWTEVSNREEGRFMERVAEGAFRATIAKDRAAIRVLLDHGQHPHVGRLPLAPLEIITEDPRGLFYGGTLFDTLYNRELVPGLRAGLYGSSVRWIVTREDPVRRVRSSATNPEGLPERTVREARLVELGPTLFPVYRSTTAAARAITRPRPYPPITLDAFMRKVG